MRPCFVILPWLALSACHPALTPKQANASRARQAQPPEFVAIAELEDRRSLGDNKLVMWALTSNDAAVRRRALIALGRLQDPSTAEPIAKGLTDPDAAARSEAAFAVGLLGLSWVPLADDAKVKLTTATLEAEDAEAEPSVKATLLEALGRLGTPAAVERLVDRLAVEGDVQARAALSLGVAAKNGAVLPARTVNALSALLKKELPPATRFGATYALMQAKLPAARVFLLLAAGDDASNIRAVAAKGLGDVGGDADTVTLKRLLDDPDYRVTVEATRSLARLAMKCKAQPCPALSALSDLSLRTERFVRGDASGGGQPLLALAQSPLPPAARPLLVSLRAQLDGAKAAADQRLRKDAANLDCRLAAAIDRLGGSLVEVVNCGNGLVDEPRRLALGLNELASVPAADPGKRAAELGSFLFHPDARVKLAALNLLGETKAPASVDKVKTQLNSNDPVLAASAAAAIAKLGDKASIPAVRALAQKYAAQADVAATFAEALATLDAKEAIGDLEPWLASPDPTLRAATAEALGKLKGVKVQAPRVERPARKGPAVELADLGAKLLVSTEKGQFEVELFTVDAPLTSVSMLALAEKGFFKNLTFHRVVPDFVVQGGDPRGDGEGGPGYSLRCEINRHAYARGVVGMALSGKDTGGSQFFVTAAPQPHLDGRYTAFGVITKGLEVIDALFEGDRILDVKAVK